MDSLMTVFLSDGFADQGSQLALGNVAFVKYHAADNDPIDGIHLGQAAVDLLLKDPIGNIILHELAELLQVHDYRIVNSAGALSLKDKTHNFIFAVTPERMLYIMSDPEAVKIDYIFVDEAHKISERDGRSAFYYKIIQMAVQDENERLKEAILKKQIPMLFITTTLIMCMNQSFV